MFFEFLGFALYRSTYSDEELQKKIDQIFFLYTFVLFIAAICVSEFTICHVQQPRPDRFLSWFFKLISR